MNPQSTQQSVETLQRLPKWQDHRPRGLKWVKAASLLAEGKTTSEIARELQVTYSAVHSWRKHPKFITLCDHHQKRFAESVLKEGIARKDVRINKLVLLAGKIERLIEARADEIGAAIAGGDTGLLAHDQKSIGSGPFAQIVDVYEVDAALLREYRATIEQAAKEIGGHFDEGAVGPPNTINNLAVSVPVQICFGDGTNEMP